MDIHAFLLVYCRVYLHVLYIVDSQDVHDRGQVVAVFEKVQQELISTKKKLDVVEEGFVEAKKMLRTSTVSWSEGEVDVCVVCVCV